MSVGTDGCAPLLISRRLSTMLQEVTIFWTKFFYQHVKILRHPQRSCSLSSSDHNSIVLTPSASYANSNLRSSRFVRDARPSNRRVVREKLCQVNWSPLFQSQSCDDQFTFFTDTINEIIETSLPLRRVKTDSSDKPWITPEIKTLIAKRQRAWSRGNVSTFKRYRNMVNAQCKKARNSYYNKNIALRPTIQFKTVVVNGKKDRWPLYS